MLWGSNLALSRPYGAAGMMPFFCPFAAYLLLLLLSTTHHERGCEGAPPQSEHSTRRGQAQFIWGVLTLFQGDGGRLALATPKPKAEQCPKIAGREGGTLTEGKGPVPGQKGVMTLSMYSSCAGGTGILLRSMTMKCTFRRARRRGTA